MVPNPMLCDLSRFRSGSSWPLSFGSAFTTAECARIVQIYDSRLHRVVDDATPASASRVCHFDDQRSLLEAGSLDWILARVASRSGMDGSGACGAAALRELVNLTFMHTFTPEHPYFDWHTDTVPNDGSGRTYNLNVMLSVPGHDFEGGQLRVGDSKPRLAQGDLYAYPASLPHAVLPLSAGLRRTLVVVLRAPQANAGAGSDGSRSDVAKGTDSDLRRASYWRAVDRQFQTMLRGPLGLDPKVQFLRATFLEAQGRLAEAETAYWWHACRSAATRPDGAELRRGVLSATTSTETADAAGSEQAALGQLRACMDPGGWALEIAVRVVAWTWCVWYHAVVLWVAVVSVSSFATNPAKAGHQGKEQIY